MIWKMMNYSKNKGILWFMLVSLFLQSTLNAQKDTSKEKFYQSFDLSYIAGGHAHNDNYLFTPGYSLKFSYGKIVNSHILVGLGTGYVSLTNENFLSQYIEILGKKKNKINTPFISFQGGYSIGWNNNPNTTQHYEMDGGIFINSGLGRMIKVNEKYALLLQCSYCHQFAKVKYRVFGEKDYSEVLHYNMLQISIGVLFDWK